MSGGIASYMVIEPMPIWELRARLMHAANTGTVATFTAESMDDAHDAPRQHEFAVKVKSAQFDAPVAFDVTDEEGHPIHLRLNEPGPVMFDLFT